MSAQDQPKSRGMTTVLKDYGHAVELTHVELKGSRKFFSVISY